MSKEWKRTSQFNTRLDPEGEAIVEKVRAKIRKLEERNKDPKNLELFKTIGKAFLQDEEGAGSKELAKAQEETPYELVVRVASTLKEKDRDPELHERVNVELVGKGREFQKEVMELVFKLDARNRAQQKFEHWRASAKNKEDSELAQMKREFEVLKIGSKTKKIMEEDLLNDRQREWIEASLKKELDRGRTFQQAWREESVMLSSVLSKGAAFRIWLKLHGKT